MKGTLPLVLSLTLLTISLLCVLFDLNFETASESEGIPPFTFHYDYFEEQYYEDYIYSSGDAALIKAFTEGEDVYSK